MLSKLTEVYPVSRVHVNKKENVEFGLRDIFVNPSSISMIRSEPTMKRHLTEGRLPEGIDARMEFSRISITSTNHSSSIVVVGDPEMIQDKLKQSKQLLQG